ncbi:MAG: cytochrome c [Acidimicrobiales bacterium]
MRTPTPLRGLLAAGLTLVLFLGGCAEDPPAVPLGPDGEPDDVLALGRDVFGSRCSSCHGSSGGGGTGARLAGEVVEKFPDPADQVAVVRDGRQGMPSFGGTLTEAEIEAVVRYTREVLK